MKRSQKRLIHLERKTEILNKYIFKYKFDRIDLGIVIEHRLSMIFCYILKRISIELRS